MSIKPLDLQTLFVKMNEVSKTVAASEQASHELQEKEGEKLKREDRLRDETISRTEEEKADRKIKDQEGKGSREKEKRASRDRKKKKDGESKTVYIEDPDMGHHIDISS